MATWSFDTVENGWGDDYVASLRVIDGYYFTVRQNQVSAESWSFDADPEGWTPEDDETLVWDFTNPDALGSTGFIKFVLPSGLGESPGEALSPVFVSPTTNGGNVVFWYRIENEDVITRAFDLSVNSYVSAVATEIYIESVELAAGGTSEWKQISMYVPGAFDQLGIKVTAQDNNGDYTIYVDEAALNVSEFWGGEPFDLGIAFISDIPFKIETPDALALNSLGSGFLLAVASALGSNMPEIIYDNSDGDFMVVSSATYDNWDAPDSAAGNPYKERITALYYTSPCSGNNENALGAPTGQIPIVTNTGQVIYLPPGQPGQVLTGGGPGQPPVWVDAPDGLPADKGNLMAGDGSAWAIVSVGADGKVLTADSNETTGVKWGDVEITGNCVDGGTF